MTDQPQKTLPASPEDAALGFFGVIVPLFGLVRGYAPGWMLLWLAVGIGLLVLRDRLERRHRS